MRSLPAPALRGPGGLGRACGRRDGGCWRSRRASRAARSAGTWARLCAYLGTPEAEARWVAPRPRTAGRPALAAGRVPGRRTGRASSRSTATRPRASATATGWRRCSRTCPLFRAFAETRRVRYEPVAARPWSTPWSGPGGRRDGRRRRRPVIAIADWADVKTRADQEIVCARVRGRRVRLRAGRSARHGDQRRAPGRGRRGPWTSSTGAAVLTELVEREGQVQPFLERLSRRAGRLRELLPLPALGGQGLLRDPDRRVVRVADDRGGVAARAPRRALDAPRGRAQDACAEGARSTSCRT